MVSNEIFNLLKQYARDLSDEQKAELFAEDEPKSDYEHKIEECPFCHSKLMVKNGHKSGTQRYLCKGCRKTFGASHDTILKWTKKRVRVWERYIKNMLEKKTIRQCAAECGISEPTSFKWRHKILDALTNMMNDVSLNGIVESDETYERLSFKGSQDMPRLPHKRGGSVHTRGLSQEQACISCAINHNALSIGRMTNLGKPTWQDVNKLLADKIASGSVFVTDSFRGYDRIAYDMDLDHIKIKRNRHANGAFNIQTINNYHMQFKKLINRTFNGVATKYINNYVVYHNFLNYSRGTLDEKYKIMRNFVFTTSSKNVFLDNRRRAAIPVYQHLNLV